VLDDKGNIYGTTGYGGDPVGQMKLRESQRRRDLAE
jgi:hypothetical protein